MAGDDACRTAARSGRGRRRRASGLLTSLAIALLVGSVALGAPCRCWAEPLVFITNPGVSLGSVSSGDLIGIYTGRSSRIGAFDVRPVNYKAGNPYRAVFESVVLKMDPEAYANQLRAMEFLGGFDLRPATFRSVEAVREYVARTRGGLGFVPSWAVDASVRAIPSVDGVATTAPGYPLVVNSP